MDLEAWAKQREAALEQQRKQQQNLPPPATTPTATSLKEQGNAAFKAGNFVQAESLYSSSLAKEETVEALCNRAFARIRLLRLQDAVADCTRALALKPNHVKALARRAQAHSLSGAHNAAIEDLLQACAIEPHNKALKTELERERALVSALEPAAASASTSKASSTAFAQGGSALVEEIELPATPARPPTTSRTRQQAAPQPASLDTATLAAALQVADQTLHLPANPPANLYAFESKWRDFKAHPDLRRRLLVETMTTRDDFERCFGKTLEPDLFLEMVAVLPHPASEESHRALLWVMDLGSFALTSMFLTAKNKELVESRLRKE